ncbi:hypothetical protein HDU78_011546, partial [Chytriomyces hyalinus]
MVTSRPVEPETTTQFDARHTATAKELEDMYQQQHDVVMKLATQAAISASTQATGEVDTPPVLNLEVEKLKLEQIKHKVESNKRLFDKEARTHSLIRAGYDSDMRVFKSLHQAHAKWVSFLKEHLDVMHSQTTLSGLLSLYEMLDSLFVHCNSKDYASMTSEWNSRWAKTAQEWPINQIQWADLRERYFIIHGGHTADKDKELACLLKARLMEIIPAGDREFGPLLLAIQADRATNSMDSAEVLKHINECMSDKALLRPTVKAKLTGEKRARDNTGGKWCSHHNSSSHNDEECRKLAELAANNQPANKKLKTSKGAKAEAKPAKGKKAATKATGKTPTKASKTEQGLADQVKALEAKLETLVQSATNSKKIQVLKTKVDSGASKHVAPVELALDNVTEVTTPHFLIDATNNQSPIQMQGDLTHISGDDRIILTSSNAYYQAAGDSTMHQIAKVVSGMYCMAPLRKIPEVAKVSACQLITKSMPPTLTIQRQPTPG